MVPPTVESVSRPEAVAVGTVVANVVAVAEPTNCCVVLNPSLSLIGFGSKLVPVIVIAVPTVAMVGVKLVIEGWPEPVVTVKLVAVVKVPSGVVT